MARNAASKVVWVGRATVFLDGLSVVLAPVLGVATTALGANCDFFKVGKANTGASHAPLTNVERGPFVGG